MNYADAGGVRIAYDDEGLRADDAVVFLGGWCSSARSFFGPLAERLAARRRVIRLDWRGHGDSGRPDADFGHDELADDAMAVIEATGVRRVVPVSQAHGGWPAIRLRRRLGDRVTKIVLLSWMVLDPPPPFLTVFGMLQDPGRWQQGLDDLLAGWLAGAPQAVADWVRRERDRYGFDMWSRAARAVTADYARHGNPLRAAADLDRTPDILHLFSQPRAAEFLAGQQEFSAANPWLSVKRLGGATHSRRSKSRTRQLPRSRTSSDKPRSGAGTDIGPQPWRVQGRGHIVRVTAGTMQNSASRGRTLER